MNDVERVFIQDSREKKITARSARNMRTHNGKGGSIKFPSDYLSRKDLKAMSGECIEYKSLKKPMSWDEFKELPDDLKVEYINSIRKRFGVPDKYIAEMFGVSAHTVQLYFQDLKCNLGRGSGHGNRKWDKDRFLAWRTGADENLVSESQEPIDDEDIVDSVVEDVTEDVPDTVAIAKPTNIVPVRPTSGRMNFDCTVTEAMDVILNLLGNSHVRLSVEWDVIQDT